MRCGGTRSAGRCGSGQRLKRAGDARAAQLRGARGARLRRVAAALLLPGLLGASAAHAFVHPVCEAERDPALPALEAAALASFAQPAWALRAALAARDGGEPARAVGLLRAVSERHVLIADHADLLRAHLLLGWGCAAEALEAAHAGLERMPASAVQALLGEALGNAHRALGQEASARAAWEGAAQATRDIALRARLQLEIARSLERNDRFEAAVRAYRRLWTQHPLREAGRVADERLGALEKRLGQPLRESADWRKRGDSLAGAGRNEEALAAYDHALTLVQGARERRPLLERRARSLFRMRRYTEATEAYAALAWKADSELWRARALARSGNVPGAVRDLEALAVRKGVPRSVADQARLLAALLLEDESPPERQRARELFAQLARSAGSSSLVQTALWHLGWSAYREGNLEEARRALAKLDSRYERDPEAQLRPRYWLARSELRAAPESARARLAQIADEYPLSYYGWRARTQLEGSERAGPPAGGDRALPRGTARLKPAELERPRILLAAGLPEAAGAELEQLEVRAGGLDDRLGVARLYSEAERYHRAQRLLVSAYSETLARGPRPGLEELWWLAWPRAFAETLDTLAPEAVEPALVWAVMREESGFRPEVTSFAGARGLLQIMPETGRRLAADAGLEVFGPDDLFVPATNIRLGSLYLDQLTRRFGGRVSAAIGSYNAGPQAVARWVAERDGEADDEWVESIPYSQTRTYVKRVLRSLNAYRELY